MPVDPTKQLADQIRKTRSLYLFLKSRSDRSQPIQSKLNQLPCSPIGGGWTGFLATAANDLAVVLPALTKAAFQESTKTTQKPTSVKALQPPSILSLMASVSPAMRTSFQSMSPSLPIDNKEEHQSETSVALLVTPPSICSLCGNGLMVPCQPLVRNLLGNTFHEQFSQVTTEQQPLWKLQAFRCGHINHSQCQSLLGAKYNILNSCILCTKQLQ